MSGFTFNDTTLRPMHVNSTMDYIATSTMDYIATSTMDLGNTAVTNGRNATVIDGPTVKHENSRPPMIIDLITCAAGIIANILTLISIKFLRTSVQPKHIFLANLALSDILVHVCYVLLHPPSGASIRFSSYLVDDLLKIWPSSDDFCTECYMTVAITLLFVAYMTSAVNIFGLVVNQYYVFVHPMHYSSTITNRRARWSVLLAWLISFSVVFIYYVELMTVFDATNGNFFATFLENSRHLYVIFLLSVGLLSHVIIGLYIKMYYEIRTHQDRVKQYMPDSQFKKEKRTTLTFFMLFLSIVLLWWPYKLIFLFAQFHTFPVTRFTQYIGEYLMLVNPLFNPILYAFRLSDVQDAYRDMLSSACCVSARDKARQESVRRMISSNSNDVARNSRSFLRGFNNGGLVIEEKTTAGRNNSIRSEFEPIFENREKSSFDRLPAVDI